MNKKILIGAGIVVGVVAIVGIGFGISALIKKNREPDDIDDDVEDFDFDNDFLEGEDFDDEEEDFLENNVGEDDENEILMEIIEKSPYTIDSFSSEQLNSLRYCIKNGYDISGVINPIYTSDQIVTVCSGIDSGYDPKYFANSELTVGQMLKIIQGLAAGVDVSIYANKKYNETQMGLILISLMAEIDTSLIINDDGTLKFNDTEMKKVMEKEIQTKDENPHLKTYFDILTE